MSIVFDDDKNWRNATAEENELIKEWASARIHRNTFTFWLASIIFIWSAIVLIILGIVMKEPIIAIASVALLIMVYPTFRIYMKFSHYIKNKKYEVQKGKITDIKKIVGRNQNVLYTFEGNGYTKDLHMPHEAFGHVAIGKECLIIKLEPKGPGWDDPIYYIPIEE